MKSSGTEIENAELIKIRGELCLRGKTASGKLITAYFWPNNFKELSYACVGIEDSPVSFRAIVKMYGDRYRVHNLVPMRTEFSVSNVEKHSLVDTKVKYLAYLGHGDFAAVLSEKSGVRAERLFSSELPIALEFKYKDNFNFISIENDLSCIVSGRFRPDVIKQEGITGSLLFEVDELLDRPVTIEAFISSRILLRSSVHSLEENVELDVTAEWHKALGVYSVTKIHDLELHKPCLTSLRIVEKKETKKGLPYHLGVFEHPTVKGVLAETWVYDSHAKQLVLNNDDEYECQIVDSQGKFPKFKLQHWIINGVASNQSIKATIRFVEKITCEDNAFWTFQILPSKINIRLLESEFYLHGIAEIEKDTDIDVILSQNSAILGRWADNVWALFAITKPKLLSGIVEAECEALHDWNCFGRKTPFEANQSKFVHSGLFNHSAMLKICLHNDIKFLVFASPFILRANNIYSLSKGQRCECHISTHKRLDGTRNISQLYLHSIDLKKGANLDVEKSVGYVWLKAVQKIDDEGVTSYEWVAETETSLDYPILPLKDWLKSKLEGLPFKESSKLLVLLDRIGSRSAVKKIIKVEL